MPSVDVTSLLTSLTPIRHSSYTMPVLSPRHGSSSTLTSSYRSTYSSSSIERPFSYTSPRTYSYTSRTYHTDDTKKYTRHSSISDEPIRSYEKRDSISRDSSTSRSYRDTSLTRNDYRTSRNDLSSTMLDSVSDIRSRYSPANYVPNVFRKTDYGRSKSIGNDIGKPPIEPKSVKLKKVTENTICNNITNNTNTDINKNNDKNGNRTSVAEIRKKFEHKKTENKFGSPPKLSKTIEEKNSLTENKFFTRPAKLSKTADDLNSSDPKLQTSAATELNNKLYIQRPPKCSKTNLISQETSVTIPEETTEENNVENNDSSMDVSEITKVFNHTSNFASYIPSKELNNDNEAMNEDSDVENTENNEIFCKNDLTTSPRLNRASLTQNSVASSSTTPTINNILPNSIQRASPITARDDDRYERSSIKNQGLNGLKNIGNTCFMNSVIQCLSNTRYLLEYVKGDTFMDDLNTSISQMKGALIKAFSQVIQELWSPDTSDRVVNTLALKSQIQRFAPRFIGYSQQDAQEFLRYLLEGLHEDVNRVTTKPTPIHTEIDDKLSDSQKSAEAWGRYLRCDNSRVVDIFVGQLKSTLRCTHCGHCSVTFDPFWDLSLPIPQRQGQLRLQQCLDCFTREETLDGDEKPTCSKCKERRKCTKSFSIQKFPKILVIHLKRFSPTERFRGKLNALIDFPLNNLDLSQYAATSGHTDCVYNLYAVSNHSGTTYSGHYTAYCKHPYSGMWHEYNDSRVSNILSKNVVSSEGYVLFYELAGQNSHL